MSILYLHLTDGTDIITFAEATTTGALRLFQPRRVTLSLIQGEAENEVKLQWQLGDIHPFQTLTGFNPLNEVRADNILYSFGDQQIPAGLLKDYTELVMPPKEQPQADKASAETLQGVTEEAPTEQVVENDAPVAAVDHSVTDVEAVEIPAEAVVAEQPAAQ